MTDPQIIALFWERDEDAIRETDRAYGRQLFSLSDRIVRDPQDAQECVSDTYMKAWETIPPQRPVYFFAYLAKLCRNFSLERIQMALCCQAQRTDRRADAGAGILHPRPGGGVAAGE